jgi:hypothetical protein
MNPETKKTERYLDMKRLIPEFEKKFIEVRKVTQRHTVESLTIHAGEYIRELENHLIFVNGIYEGEILKA